MRGTAAVETCRRRLGESAPLLSSSLDSPRSGTLPGPHTPSSSAANRRRHRTRKLTDVRHRSGRLPPSLRAVPDLLDLPRETASSFRTSSAPRHHRRLAGTSPSTTVCRRPHRLRQVSLPLAPGPQIWIHRLYLARGPVHADSACAQDAATQGVPRGSPVSRTGQPQSNPKFKLFQIISNY